MDCKATALCMLSAQCCELLIGPEKPLQGPLSCLHTKQKKNPQLYRTFKYYFQNESECFTGISKHPETNYCFEVFGYPDEKHQVGVLEITSHDHS